MNENMVYFEGKVQRFLCDLQNKFGGQNVAPMLLAGIFLQLRELNDAVNFGATKFDIRPVLLTTTAQKIVERDVEKRVRKVSVWIDSASGGPVPTIRIGKSASSSNSGGIRVNAGQVNELGEVPPDTELYGVASTSIQIYVIERA